jgi:hypothetical protein
MKKILYAVIIWAAFIASSLFFSSCAAGKDPWGNKQTRKERKALNEIGCPGHNEFRSN